MQAVAGRAHRQQVCFLGLPRSTLTGGGRHLAVPASTFLAKLWFLMSLLCKEWKRKKKKRKLASSARLLALFLPAPPLPPRPPPSGGRQLRGGEWHSSFSLRVCPSPPVSLCQRFQGLPAQICQADGGPAFYMSLERRPGNTICGPHNAAAARLNLQEGKKKKKKAKNK